MRYRLLPFLLLLGLGAVPAQGQGCSMCRDMTAGSAPALRQSLRKAIPILGGMGMLLFSSLLVVALRTPSDNPSREK